MRGETVEGGTSPTTSALGDTSEVRDRGEVEGHGDQDCAGHEGLVENEVRAAPKSSSLDGASVSARERLRDHIFLQLPMAVHFTAADSEFLIEDACFPKTIPVWAATPVSEIHRTVLGFCLDQRLQVDKIEITDGYGGRIDNDRQHTMLDWITQCGDTWEHVTSSQGQLPPWSTMVRGRRGY